MLAVVQAWCVTAFLGEALMIDASGLGARLFGRSIIIIQGGWKTE